MTTKTILITGSSGYVGQHLIAHLVRHGINSTTSTNNDDCRTPSNDNSSSSTRYKVYCAYHSLPTFPSDLDALCRSDARTTMMMHPSIASMQAFSLDFQNSDDDVASAVRRACCDNANDDARIDVIIHLAALSSPTYCQSHPEEAWKINVPLGLLKLDAPIIYVSTDQVYEGTRMFYTEDGDETLPVNLYGRTKLAFERVLSLASESDGDDCSTHNRCVNGEEDHHAPLLTPRELGDSVLPQHLTSQHLSSQQITTRKSKLHSHVILRSSLILGKPPPFPRGCNKGAHPSFLQFVHRRLLASTPTTYFTDEYRSVVHVEDVICALVHFTGRALECRNNDNDSGDSDSGSIGSDRTVIYNLGGRERVNRYQLAVAVAKHLQLDYKQCVIGAERGDGSSVPSPPDISMNVDKLTRELGIERLDGLEEIIENTFL